MGDVVPLAVLHHAVVDDHVDLAGPVFHGVLGLKDLGGSGVVAVGEADDGADLQIPLDVSRRLLDEGRGDAHGRAAELHGLVAEGLDLLPGSFGLEQGVIYMAENGRSIHNLISFCGLVSWYLGLFYPISRLDSTLNLPHRHAVVQQQGAV